MNQIMENIAQDSFQVNVHRGAHHRVSQVEEVESMKSVITAVMEKFGRILPNHQANYLPPLVHGDSSQGLSQNEEVNYMG